MYISYSKTRGILIERMLILSIILFLEYYIIIIQKAIPDSFAEFTEYKSSCYREVGRWVHPHISNIVVRNRIKAKHLFCSCTDTISQQITRVMNLRSIHNIFCRHPFCYFRIFTYTGSCHFRAAIMNKLIAYSYSSDCA